MSLDTDITTILAKSIGPSAPIFLKQVCIKMKKSPADLTKADMDALIELIYEGVKKTLGDETALKIKENLKTMK
ncbi:MAG TPA: hypothetical protein VN429_09360 [Methanospirillum sp.]|uniref:hypothetical protein n=1 Tax=Methanospirillum sp. TaxID=45200 RepID=UPI002C9790C9|nr:hypothetical protein [Methanospirillum sp.]HWQ64610.1 hypothetical protein [Methanospirillum sp.]